MFQSNLRHLATHPTSQPIQLKTWTRRDFRMATYAQRRRAIIYRTLKISNGINTTPRQSASSHTVQKTLKRCGEKSAKFSYESLTVSPKYIFREDECRRLIKRYVWSVPFFRFFFLPYPWRVIKGRKSVWVRVWFKRKKKVFYCRRLRVY